MELELEGGVDFRTADVNCLSPSLHRRGRRRSVGGGGGGRGWKAGTVISEDLRA